MPSMRVLVVMMAVSSAMAEDRRSLADRAVWEPVRRLLNSWSFTTEYALSIGTAEHGRVFLHESGNFTMRTQIPTGSTSKWPSAMMFASLVADGTIGSLDDHVSKYLPWWTKDPRDMRSEITLRHLLTFTSGFGGGHPGDEFNTRAARQWRARQPASRPLTDRAADRAANSTDACDSDRGDISRCARSIYETVALIGRPGTVYSYNSNHLQLAAGLAVAATGLPIHELVRRYLFSPNGMTQSYYAGKCPDFAGSLVTTGVDYEAFLRGVLGRAYPSAALVAQSERDGTPFLSDEYTLYGNYGFGHFLMCFDSTAGFTSACKEARAHFDPGAFGFIPIIDRKHGYYLNLVAAEVPPTGSYPLSGIPEYLAVAIKTHVDAILSDAPPDAEDHQHHTPSLLSLSVADVNYCLDCKLRPQNCE